MTMSTSIDKDSATRFLRTLDPNAHAFTFQLIGGKYTRILHGSLHEVGKELVKANAEGSDVYVTVNETDLKGRELANIIRPRALWQEDDGDGRPTPLEPHIVVQTSPGHFHRYWLVNGETTLDDTDGWTDVMVKQYGSDPGAKGRNRVLRVPGFWNHKRGCPVELLATEDHKPYARPELVAALGDPEPVFFSPPNGKDWPTLDQDGPESWELTLKRNDTGDESADDYGFIKDLLRVHADGDWAWEILREFADRPKLDREDYKHRTVFRAWQELQAERATVRDALGAEEQGTDWPEPQPLPDGLPTVAAFDYGMLPDSLRPWAQDICKRVQCAPDYVAVAIMAGLGSIIGRKVGIRPQACTDWTVTPNQWALVVGRPGVLKSPALEAALSPIKRLAAVATEAYQIDAKNHALAVRLAKLRAEEGEKAARKALSSNPECDVSNLLTQEDPEAPTLRRYIAVDSNAASLGELHRQNLNGLLVHRDEMVSLLKNLDREDQAEARGFYLTGWNGDSAYTFDRIGRGLNLHIPAVCLSMLGSTQPGRIAEYLHHAVKGGTGDDGLIQRFGLLVWPDIGGEWRNVDRWPDGEAKRAAFKVYEDLDRLDPEAIGAQRDTGIDGEPDGVPYLRFDTDGLEQFVEWRTDLESRLRNGDLHPAMESHLAKYRKLVPALALTLHLASGSTGPVSLQATQQALAWAKYLETHAHRAYASVSMPEIGVAKAILARIRKGDLPRIFSSRDVWRPGWAMLSDRSQVANALSLLVELNWLSISRTETLGRPATVYHVNPRGFS